jgi:hypothetical protein
VNTGQKEAHMAYSDALSWHMPGWKNMKHLSYKNQFLGKNFKPAPSKYKPRVLPTCP